MTKLKLALALFAAYTAGEYVTNRLTIRRINRAFKNKDLFTKVHIETAWSTAWEQGGDAALADPVAVATAHDKLFPLMQPQLVAN